MLVLNVRMRFILAFASGLESDATDGLSIHLRFRVGLRSAWPRAVRDCPGGAYESAATARNAMLPTVSDCLGRKTTRRLQMPEWRSYLVHQVRSRTKDGWL